MKFAKSLFLAMAVTVAAWSQDDVATVAMEPESELPGENVPQNLNSVPQKVQAKKVRPPYEHRGFFFSMGIGFSYLSTTSDEDDLSFSSGGGYSYPGDTYVYIPQNEYYYGKKVHEEMSCFGLPYIEYRFGKSIGNLVVLYSIFSGSLYRGNAEYFRTNYGIEYLYNQDGVLTSVDTLKRDTTLRKEEAVGFSVSAGLGLSIYPFRNPSSLLNGLYIGASGGFEGFDANMEGSFSILSTGGIFSRYEIGKDWWVSETWSIGVGFAYINVYVIESGEDGKGERQSINLFIRLTRG